MLCTAGAGVTRSQESGRAAVRLEFRAGGDSIELRLPHRFLQPLSDSLVVEGVRTLARGSDYTLQPAAGVITLRAPLLRDLPADGSRAYTLCAFYRYLPFTFAPSYARRTLTVLRDSAGVDSVAAPAVPRFALDDIFGRTVQKSGSLTRGFTIGTNRDLSLTSGFRMQLAGSLGPDVEVAASLTDENTPIQPEGTTQTLQEFDNVFVELRSRRAAATLGDFELELSGTEFARLTRKVQGARGTVSVEGGAGRAEALVAGSVTRGTFATNQFPGIEGVQGPYLLAGRDGRKGIVVIAGTEKVYVDGERQARGETNEYVIDYSLGELRFTTRRLITAASRIVVDFEYAERHYTRSLFAAAVGGAFADSAGSVTVSFVREADDPDAPIDVVLSDSARRVLAAAGADPSKAFLDGVTPVDSNGQYVEVDTILAGGKPVRFYRFDPGSPSARSMVTFSFVGPARGDYVRVRPGEFRWIGPGGGDFLPIILLPFARSQQLVDVRAAAAPLPGVAVSAEVARSELDVNRFSREDGIVGGHAISVAAAAAPRNVRLGSLALGDLDVTLRERFVDSRFTPVDRTTDIEFNRKWGIDSLRSADEEIREASLRSTPIPALTVAGGYGSISRGDDFRSVRTEASLEFRAPDAPSVRYRIERIRTDDNGAASWGLWVRQRGSVAWTLAWLVPSLRFEAENRRLRSAAAGTLLDGSFRFLVFAPALQLAEGGPLALSGSLEFRTDDRGLEGTLLRESRSFTQTYAARLRETATVSSSLDLTLRKKTFSEVFRGRGNPDIRSVLVRHQTRLTPWKRAVDADLLYQVATEQSSRLERVFVRVARGSGSYRYLGDLNGNGLADDAEFQQVRFDGDYIPVTLPSDDFVPVIDLNAGLRVRLQPSRLLDAGGTLSGIFRAVTTESMVRIEEKSTEPELRRIYLLDFSAFRQEKTTLAGSVLFSQDILLLDGNPPFSTRLRFLQRAGLTRFSSGIERGFARERSIRVRWQLLSEVAGQVDAVNRTDRVTAAENPGRTRAVTSNGITLDIAYRPDQRLELGWTVNLAHAVDEARVPLLASDFNGESVRLVYAFPGSGQARVEAAREEVLLGAPVESIPFELTGGRVGGKTWVWRGSMEYRVTQFLQGSMNYEGRAEGGGTPVHTGRLELRAVF